MNHRPTGATAVARQLPATPSAEYHGTVHAWDLQMRAAGLALSTRTQRRRLVEKLADSCGDDPRAASRDDVVTFLAQPLAAATRASYFGHLKQWFTWLVAVEERLDNPMTVLKPPRTPRANPRPLSVQQVHTLLSTRMHRRTRTMILLGLYAGLRVSEIAGMRGELVDVAGQRLRVLGKGGTDLVLPLHPVLAAEASGYPRRGWWFPTYTGNRRGRAGVAPILGRSVSDIVGDVMARAGIAATPHALRHTHATMLLRGGADLRVVQELMRHSSVATTQRYTAVADDQLRTGLVALPDLRVSVG